MRNTIGEVKIKTGKKKRRETTEIKQLREEKNIERIQAGN